MSMDLPQPTDEMKPVPRTDWQWLKDVKELADFSVEEFNKYVVRPAENGPRVWCKLCGQAVTSETNQLQGLVEETVKHHRLTHPVAS